MNESATSVIKGESTDSVIQKAMPLKEETDDYEDVNYSVDIASKMSWGTYQVYQDETNQNQNNQDVAGDKNINQSGVKYSPQGSPESYQQTSPQYTVPSNVITSTRSTNNNFVDPSPTYSPPVIRSTMTYDGSPQNVQSYNVPSTIQYADVSPAAGVPNSPQNVEGYVVQEIGQSPQEPGCTNENSSPRSVEYSNLMNSASGSPEQMNQYDNIGTDTMSSPHAESPSLESNRRGHKRSGKHGRRKSPNKRKFCFGILFDFKIFL